MSLNRQQEHRLRVIEADLCRSEPELGAMFGMFGRLYTGQDMPGGEQVPTGQGRFWRARRLAAVLTVMAAAPRRARVRASAASPERTADSGETGGQHDHSGPAS